MTFLFITVDRLKRRDFSDGQKINKDTHRVQHLDKISHILRSRIFNPLKSFVRMGKCLCVRFLFEVNERNL